MRASAFRRWWPAFAFTSLLAPALAAGPAPGEPVDARAWLARIHAAASQRNYQGTMVFSAGGRISSSRVVHFCVGEQTYEELESLDGRMQRVYRHNDVIHTVWPQERVAVVENRGAIVGLSSLTQSVELRALDQYELQPEGRERVAGRDAFVFLLKPRDEWRYAQRLWADHATGLMLRADVIGAGRQVLESTAFSTVEIGIRAQPASVLQGMRQLEGYRVLRPVQEATQLEAEGWALTRAVPGFALRHCVKRALEAAADGTGGGQVLQAVFSDGMTHVSLFIEPFDPRRHRQPLQAQLGATGTLMLRRGDYWITAMGDVPAATLVQFSDALERRR
jgi:sigma-E factor negative regulatory protein RseB